MVEGFASADFKSGKVKRASYSPLSRIEASMIIELPLPPTHWHFSQS